MDQLCQPCTNSTISASADAGGQAAMSRFPRGGPMASFPPAPKPPILSRFPFVSLTKKAFPYPTSNYFPRYLIKP